METLPGKEGLTILRRLIAYSEQVFRSSAVLIAGITDRRLEPRISTRHGGEIGSCRVLGENGRPERFGDVLFWKHWLDGPLPGADTMGNVHSKMEASTLRNAMHQVYGQLKRNKALPDNRGISLAIVDGHESHSSYLQHCAGCLSPTIHFPAGDRVQYYHRQVTLLLVPGAPANREPLRIPLDHEPQLAAEDEVATANRLLARVTSAIRSALP